MKNIAKELQLRKIQALKLIKLNNFQQAEPELLSLSQLLPKDKIIWLELGKLRISQMRHSEAIEYLYKAIKFSKKNAEALYYLGISLQSSGNTNEAIKYFLMGLNLEPKNIELNIQLGKAFTGLNNIKAIFYFNKALSRQPGNVSAIVGIASLHTYKGDAKNAYKTLSPLLNKLPINLLASVAFADICRPLKMCDKAIELLSSSLNGKHSLQRQTQGHFALAKLHDLNGEYNKAFNHYRMANSISKQPYNPSQDAIFFKGLISSMDEKFFSKTDKAQISTAQYHPIFIVGMPRSGTTLVEQILCTQESVQSVGELGKIGSITCSIPEEVDDIKGFPSCLEKLNTKILNKLSDDYMKTLHDLSPANGKENFVIDKMPDNFRFLGFIELLFPQAIIIHCKRNPMDTSLSCYFQNFEGGHAYSQDLKNMGIYYRMYEKLMSHWKSVLNISILDLEYEDLVSSPESTSKSLLEFCGLEWNSNCLEFFNNCGSINTASFDQVKQPIYQRSINRWKNYDKHLQPLKDGLDIYAI